MDLLQLREKEVFETLKNLKEFEFVIIGGYAVNAYTLPRFSIDCDLVVRDKSEFNKIESTLLGLHYNKKGSTKEGNIAEFRRYEKNIAENFKVSFDIMIREVFDRQTNVSIPADWIFKNSSIIILKGKTIVEELRIRIINVDALFVIKMISCRSTDIRDLFMLSLSIRDKKWIKREIGERYNFKNRFEKVREKITSNEFRKGLQGVYGLLDNRIFEKSVNSILALDD